MRVRAVVTEAKNRTGVGTSFWISMRPTRLLQEEIAGQILRISNRSDDRWFCQIDPAGVLSA
jgi:hypothetical protein